MSVFFGECRYDPRREELWRGDVKVALRPKSLALLQVLLEAPGVPHSKQELMERLWHGVVVAEGALTVCINELRSALGDPARAPRYIETLHARGYRFLAEVRQTRADPSTPRAEGFVGRRQELALMLAQRDAVLAGDKRMVLLAGEAGMGKTSLVNEALRELHLRADVVTGRCVEAYGAGEPYMPLLDALSALCRGPRGEGLRAILASHAPTWLMQMPGQVSEHELPRLAARAAGASTTRMLRELRDALTAITRERPLVLVCEDLHDSDPHTLALLEHLMREREPSGLWVIGTYRPEPSLPLRRLIAELQLHQRCERITLAPLTEPEVASYLEARLPAALAGELHTRSGGNPLFMVTLVDHLLQEGLLHAGAGLAETGIPSRLLPLLELQFARLSASERELLQTASVCGQHFTVAALAACLESDRAELIERELARLARETPLVRLGDEQRWPDGTLTQGFAFRHVLQQEVIYEAVPPARRRLLHERLAQRLRQAFLSEPATIAAELALHFERGDRPGLAAGAVADAAASALLRSAQSAALAYTMRGFSLLERARDTTQGRNRLELRLRLAEGAALLVTHGFGSSESERAYRQAHQLCAQNDDPALLAPALCGLWHHALTRAHYPEAERIAAQLGVLADAHPDPILRMQADNTAIQTRLFQGEPAAVLEVSEQEVAFYDPRQHGHLTSVYGADPGVLCRLYMALGRFLLGMPRSGLAQLERAQGYADVLQLPFAHTQVLWTRCVFAHIAGDLPALRRHAPQLAKLAGEHGFFHPHAFGRAFVAWLASEDGDSERAREELAQIVHECDQAGVAVMMPHTLSMLARVQARCGQHERALRTLEDARVLSISSGERWYLAEIYRLEAHLLRELGALAELEPRLQAALRTARAQRARPFVRRAQRSLQQIGRNAGLHP